jgi:transcription elongation factor Elf1
MPHNSIPEQPAMKHGMHLTAKFQYAPRCPDCGGELNSRTIHFNRGIAMCKVCGERTAITASWLTCALNSIHYSIDWSEARGLHFWCPRVDGEKGLVNWYCLHRHDSLQLLDPQDFDQDVQAN